MAAVPGVTGLQCTFFLGDAPGVEYTMWITSVTSTADKGVTRTQTWGGNAMVHTATGEYTMQIAGLFNPETGVNLALEAALVAETPTTFTVNYGDYARTFADCLISSYSDEAPAEGPVTFTASVVGPDMWASVPAVP